MRSMLIVFALLLGCTSLPDDGALMCGVDPSARCPVAFHCAADGRCYRDGHDPDLAVAVVGDMAAVGISDLAADAGTPVVTAHVVDTDPALLGATVSVTAMVTAVAVNTSHSVSTGRCQYLAYLQDPNGPNPSGLGLFVAPTNCAPDDGGSSCTCPQIPSSGTPLDSVNTLGDIVTVTGVVTTFGNNPPGHQLSPVLSVTKTGHGNSIYPVVFADGNGFASAGGVATYESMLVKIAPPTPFTIGNVDTVGDFLGAGTQFTGVFRRVYSGGPPYFPANASTWSAITGIANIGAVDGISPRTMSDFQP